MNSKLRAYYWLVKPGIVYGNAFAAAGGFLLAARGSIDFLLFIYMLIGISLIIASACVFNNYLDRDIDAMMKRTKNRALASGSLPVRDALIFGAFLGVAGTMLLIFGTNLLTTLVGLSAFVIYVGAYTPLKPRSVHATLIGSLAGATPPVGGYVAVTGSFDITALLLFVCLVFWQMPHFYAIALYRLHDYKSAGVPVLPLVRGERMTQLQIIFYIIGFLAATQLLSLTGATGLAFSLAMLALSVFWLSLSIKGLSDKNIENWARVVFRFSLIVLMAFTLLIAIDYWLP